MSDRTRMPRPDVRRVDMAAIWEGVEKERDRRMGKANASCAHCHHGYEYPVSDASGPQLVCHEGPPNMQMVPNNLGMAMQTVPRVVAPNFFCHRWEPKKTDS